MTSRADRPIRRQQKERQSRPMARLALAGFGRRSIKGALAAGAMALVVAGFPGLGAAEGEAADLPKAESLAGAYLAGGFAEALGDYGAAAVLLDDVLSADPENPRILRRAFLANLRAGDKARAVELAKQVIERFDPAPPAAMMTAVIDAIDQEDWPTALDRIDTIPMAGLARYAKPLLEAWTHAGAGDTDRALAALEPLRNQGGFEQILALNEGLILVDAERFETAALVLEGANDEITQAPVRVVVALSRAYRGMGRVEEARALLADYVEAYPTAATVLTEQEALAAGAPLTTRTAPSEGIAEGLYQLASGVQRQSAEIALIYGRLAGFIEPEFDLPHLLVGGILEGQERYRDAILTLEKVPASSAFYWQARLAIADNLAELDEDEQAIALLQAMAEERPDSTDPLVELGYIYRGQERYLDEAAVYDRAIGRIEGEPEGAHWLLFYNRGIAHERAKLWDEAEPDFLKALELKPDDPFVLNYLGYSWIEMGRNVAEAKEMIKKAVAQRQSDGYIVDSLGWVLYKIGDFEGAVGHLERAVQLRPHDPIINDHLGDAYWRVGRKREARFQWERALNLEPEADLTPLIEEKLRSGMGAPEVIDISQ
ncbi:MAG: tetratricopeptide repeat protein [Alphaproteobacteria bacterium]|nr:tetratricopeptide repeat protein [Alphaproteobacteria bacterium]